MAEAAAEGTDLQATPAAEASVTAAVRVRTKPIGSHHLLLAALDDPNSAAARTLAGLGVNLDQAREALRTVDVTGTSDEQPEEQGRRHMMLRVTDTSLIIEATDPDLIKAAQAAAEALGGQADPPGTIRGDLPESVTLGGVWLALNASLDNIHRRATGAKAKAQAGEAPPGPENARLQAEPEEPPGEASAPAPPSQPGPASSPPATRDPGPGRTSAATAPSTCAPRQGRSRAGGPGRSGTGVRAGWLRGAASR